MKQLIIFALIATAFAGCIGVPEGSAAMGDEVVIDWAAFDAETGEEVASGNGLKFVVGSGASGLGLDFERQLIGFGVNATLDFTSESDPTRPYSKIIKTDRFQLEPYPAQQDVAAETFVQAIGEEPVAGLQFDLTYFPAVVVAVDGETVTYRVQPEPGQRDPIEWVGIILVTDIEDDMVTQVLEASPGTTFTIQPPNQFNPNPPLQNLVPGSYRTRGMTATEILYDYTPAMSVDGLDQPLRFEVTIKSVSNQAPVAFDEDSFASRSSPQLLADRETLTQMMTEDSETPEAEDDHGHTH